MHQYTEKSEAAKHITEAHDEMCFGNEDTVKVEPVVSLTGKIYFMLAAYSRNGNFMGYY